MDWGGHGYSVSGTGTAAGAAAAGLNVERQEVGRSKLAAWRDRNPHAMGTWTTKYGCVVAFGGMKIYYGRCPNVLTHDDGCLVPHGGRTQSCRCTPCGALVTTKRANPVDQVLRGSPGGRWPVYCDRCRRVKADQDRDRDRKRKAGTRRKERAQRPANWRELNAQKRQHEASLVEEQHYLEYHFDGLPGCYEPSCPLQKWDDT